MPRNRQPRPKVDGEWPAQERTRTLAALPAQKPDPLSAPALHRFQTIQRSTECSFAETSVMWGCPDWDEAVGLEENLQHWLPVITEFCGVSEERELDGLILELPGPGYGDSVERLGQTVARTLRYLSAVDPSHANCMAGDIEDPTWWFTFAGQELFVLTLGPCYSASNSRYGFETGRTYLVFQPRHCFWRRIPSHPVELSRRAKEQIRRRYQQAGRPYDLAITLAPQEACRFVKPAEIGDPPVRWW